MTSNKRARDDDDTLFPATAKARLATHMDTLPTELWLDIFGDMSVKDLLSLCRTRKAFRRVLLDDNAKSIWTRALEAEGTPSCPAGVSPWTFAVLLYEKRCSMCGTQTGASITWRFVSRYCGRCVPIHLELWDTTLKEVSAMPTFRDGPLKLDAESFFVIGNVQGKAMNLKAEFQRFTETWKTKGVTGLLALKEEATQRCDWASEAYVWARGKKEEHRNEKDAGIARRLASIHARLREQGYAAELDWLDGPRWHPTSPRLNISDVPGVRKTGKLTEKEWLKICEPLEVMMRLVRTFVQKEEDDHLLRTRVLAFCNAFTRWRVGFAIQNPRTAIPRAVDLFGIPGVLAAVCSPQDNFANLACLFPHLAANWYSQHTNEVVMHVLKSSRFNALLRNHEYRERITTHTLFELAIMNFTCQGSDVCKHTQSLLRFPSVLAHPCMWSFDHWRNVNERRAAEHSMAGRVSLCAEDILECKSWSKDSLILGKHFERAVAVVLACGKNALHTQAQEMDLLPIRLYCDRCEAKRGKGGRKVMNWRDAIAHYFEHDQWDSDSLRLKRVVYSEMPINWQLVPIDLLPLVVDIEAEAAPFYEQREAETRRDACCPICDVYIAANLVGHIRNCHHDFVPAEWQPIPARSFENRRPTGPVMLIPGKSKDRKARHESMPEESQNWLAQGRARICKCEDLE